MDCRPPEDDNTQVNGPADGAADAAEAQDLLAGAVEGLTQAAGADYYRTREAAEYLARARKTAGGEGARAP